jgi:hypothetical protein
MLRSSGSVFDAPLSVERSQTPIRLTSRKVTVVNKQFHQQPPTAIVGVNVIFRQLPQTQMQP